ncbi:MAG: type IIA DNA topoisomerase subunit B, partial [Bacteroidota bacterium]
GQFIGDDMRLQPVMLQSDTAIKTLLTYYMGKNTPDRQTFIIDNLRIEKDEADHVADEAEEEVTPVAAQA